MTTTHDNQYPLLSARSLCATGGLAWNDDHAQKAIAKFRAHNIDAQTADDLVTLHVWLVAHLFNPKAYTFLGRLALALCFLFNISTHKLETLPHKE